MKRVLIAILLLGTMVAPLSAQAPLRLITRPKIPTQEVLERLNLTLGWHVRVPLDGARDYLVSVQVLPRGTGTAIKTDVVAQTSSGNVLLFDGETGALRWSVPVGIRYSAVRPAAGNDQSIIVSRRDFFYVLNRDTGAQRVFKKATNGERTFGFQLDGIPTAAPSADNNIVAFPFFDRVTTYVLPDFEKIANAREKEPEILAQEREGSVQPYFLWNFYDPTMKLLTPPVVTLSQIAVSTQGGKVLSLRLNPDAERIRYEFRTLAGLSSAMGNNGDIGYIGGGDFFLYALDLDQNRLLWRFPSGAPIVRRPEVNDADVFIVSEGRGMFRVHRFSPNSYWLEPTADRFLAAHYFKDAQDKFKVDALGRVMAKYVYAADRNGKLLIIDGNRGGLLGQFDTSAWQSLVSNEWTDRLYLANEDGQILALYPRGSLAPQVNKSIPLPVKKERGRPAAPAAPTAEPPAPSKEDEKKVDDKMGALDPLGAINLRCANRATPCHGRLVRPCAASEPLPVHTGGQAARDTTFPDHRVLSAPLIRELLACEGSERTSSWRSALDCSISARTRFQPHHGSET